jgi:hypothetical protein
VALALSLSASFSLAQTPIVDLSVNVFPTDLLNPNNGGTWTLVAKTDSTIGIAAISAYLKNVNFAGVTYENDIGSIGSFVTAVGDGVINVLYGQDTFNGPIVAGVGTISKSDGPDPLGDAAWDDATRIFSGTYWSIIPTIAVDVGPEENNTDASTFASVILGQQTIAADTAIVVRVAVPEPSTLVLAAGGIACLLVVRRRLAG